MSINFTSIEMIENHFELDGESIENLRLKLRGMQAKHHPDKHGGSFIDEDSEKQYYELSEAISFIDNMNKNNSSLVPISVVTDLTKAVTAMIAVQSEKSSKDTLLSTEINRSIASYSSRLKMPKIATTAVTIAISAIWMFPNTVKDHPVLNKLINFESEAITGIWLYTLLACVGFWVITWRKEELNKEYQEKMKTEYVQNELFTNFIRRVGRDGFTLEEFIEFLMEQYDRSFQLFPSFTNRSKQIDLPLAHAIADVILERALKRKAITSSNSGSISAVYQIVSANKSNKKDIYSHV